jgi:multimeric flavodoxin WrbA
MKAIGIVGSPRRDGNTVYLTRQVLDALKEKFETELIFLKDLDLNPCDGCHSCAKTGKCIIEDDMQIIFNKLKKSKVILLSSPVYMGGTTSRLRIFMERTWHLRKGQLKDKIGSYIVIGRRDLGVAVNEIEEYFSRMKLLKLAGIIGYGFEKNDVKTDNEALNNVNRLSHQILTMSI